MSKETKKTISRSAKTGRFSSASTDKRTKALRYVSKRFGRALTRLSER